MRNNILYNVDIGFIFSFFNYNLFKINQENVFQKRCSFDETYSLLLCVIYLENLSKMKDFLIKCTYIP